MRKMYENLFKAKCVLSQDIIRRECITIITYYYYYIMIIITIMIMIMIMNNINKKALNKNCKITKAIFN